MKNCTVLIVEDDDVQRSLLAEILKDHGFHPLTASTAEQAIKILEKENPHLVVTDVRLPGMDGITFLKKVKGMSSDVEVLVITAFSNVEDAVEAIKHGAFHYITKPFSPEVLIQLLKKACQLVSLKRSSSEEIVYRSHKMKEVLEKAKLFARTDAPVLILGESGVGKELIAKFIHRHSERCGKFVSINCAALPEELFEAELFGYEKGAFTGATGPKPGLFEEADKGTLFLDEIAELPPRLQAKLLRVLQEKEVRRLGSNVTKKVDVKIIAATNRDLFNLVKEGKFREDLFYRLNVLVLNVPPLRERKEDILELCNYFLKKFSQKYGKDIKISPEAMKILTEYEFPGNIRELENLIHRLVITCDSEIKKEDLQDLKTEKKPAISFEDFSKPLPELLAEIEKEVIKKALEKTNYVQLRAAKLLGIDEKSLRYKRKKYNI
ncbi:MAG: sigma-54-dependent Fis family transcriptional regulator [Thermodesulfobacteria bacterium]|nr:sigma-54-dependent Fis family transcriptional regulator [Thermodesulfobacteriota bacterium]